MRPRPILFASLSLFLIPLLAQSEIILAPIFKDHAVVQRDKPLPVWGRATAGEKLAVTFRDQTFNTTADADGRWIVYFAPLAASSDGAELVVTGNDTVVVKDVLVGEVWLASGQSNMEWPASRVHEDEKPMTAVEIPLLRHLKIEQTVAGSPEEMVSTGEWQTASAETVGGFSAVAYFYARELQRKIGVPVGIINSSWGGTEIEAWMSDASRQATAHGATIDLRWQQAMNAWTPERVAAYPAEMDAWQKAEEQARATRATNLLVWPSPPATQDSPARPGGLFNGMIAPLQPGAIRGVLWYQGESNAERPSEYADLFPAMIRAWRANWGDAQLPFIFVQLPKFAYGGNPRGREWARLREAQTKALELPATAMAVMIDLGEPNDVHPTRKYEVGRRLALAAKSRVYGIPGDFSGPIFAGAKREGSTMRVSFTHAGPGLVAHHRPVQSLEIAGSDRVFHAGEGRIDRDTLVVSSPAVKEPVAVRYAWSNAPEANLYDGAGLPAAPFRSDDW